jgi:FlaA1/EpsC-like NDP-sugar epimerase
VSKNLAESLFLLRGPRTGPVGEPPAGMVVRFGNVLGSRGSILPLFRRQIEKGGPVTITDPRATRFFMTIPEAVSLVLQTAGVGSAGELYVLDMGDPISIRELAEQMIRFFGYEPETDIPVQEIGLRPGEKLVESLFDEGNSRRTSPRSVSSACAAIRSSDPPAPALPRSSSPSSTASVPSASLTNPALRCIVTDGG